MRAFARRHVLSPSCIFPNPDRFFYPFFEISLDIVVDKLAGRARCIVGLDGFRQLLARVWVTDSGEWVSLLRRLGFIFVGEAVYIYTNDAFLSPQAFSIS